MSNIQNIQNNSTIDLLYTTIFQQMVRTDITPTYVEKRVLEEQVDICKQYLLTFVRSLENSIEYDLKNYSESYLTWDPEYYKEEAKKRKENLQKFADFIQETSEKEFLSKDFSVTNSDLDTIYTNYFPKSNVRVFYKEQWDKLKEKKNII